MTRKAFPASHLRLPLVLLFALAAAAALAAQAAPSKPANHESAQALEKSFFDAIRAGDAEKVLSYIPEKGVGVGPAQQHVSRDEVEQQLRTHRGLYCKLFDSSCIGTPIQLDNSRRACSYRELLTHSDKVGTAASEMTRNGVEQAVLVARIQNSQCPSDKLIDVIFNLDADGWKLFSIP